MVERFRNAYLTGVLVVVTALVFAAVAGCERAPDSSAPGAGEEVVDPAVKHLRRGWELYDKADYEGAIAAYTKAIELDADLAEAYRGRAVARAEFWAEDLEIADYTEVIRLRPNDVEAFLRRGIAYEKKGKYGKAIEDCTKVIELDPDCAEAYYRRGMSLGFQNEYEKKIVQLRKAIELDPDGKIGQDARNSLGVMDIEKREQSDTPGEPSPGTEQ